MMPQSKRFVIMMGGRTWWYGMHGTKVPWNGDVNGLLCKKGNTSVTNVDERKACYTWKETEGPLGYVGEGKDDVMVMWGYSFCTDSIQDP